MDPAIWILINLEHSEQVTAHKAQLAGRCPKLEKIRIKQATTGPTVEVVVFIWNSDGTVEWTQRENWDQWI